VIAARVRDRRSQLVLGLDPDPAALWPTAAAGGDGHLRDDGDATSFGGAPLQPLAAAVVAHCHALIDAAGPCCVAVKLQLARFEALGADAWGAARAVVACARAAGLLVIADGKRGDIDVSAAAYASALFDGVQTPYGRAEGLGADLVTLNPLMGADALRPFIDRAREVGGGVLVLVRTSNPGARDVQDLELDGGGALWERLAAIVDGLGAAGVGASGLSDVGAVVGATQPEHLQRARELMPHALFLLPGVGAQGGRVEQLAPAFAPGRAGGLISASRSISDAYLSVGGDPAEAARAQAQRLREQAWVLAEPVGGEVQPEGATRR
jgi:orotidine-5'-phosphate decarboxylase